MLSHAVLRCAVLRTVQNRRSLLVQRIPNLFLCMCLGAGNLLTLPPYETSPSSSALKDVLESTLQPFMDEFKFCATPYSFRRATQGLAWWW